MDIVDAQVHANVLGTEATLAVMDALGRSAASPRPSRSAVPGPESSLNLTVFGATGRTGTALVERPQAVKSPAGGAARVAV
jgi:hypothetical protein